MEAFVHVANVLFLASYSVRDVLWLRLLTIVAIATLIPYYIANGLMPPIYWNAVFIAINLAQVWRLILERRPVTLTDEQHRLHRLAFGALRQREFLRLLQSGAWRDVPAGTTLVEQGASVGEMIVISEGTLTVVCNGEQLTELRDGQFVGEMSYLTGAAAGASVRTSCDARLVAWDQGKLKVFLDKNTDLRAALQSILGADLVSKLRG